MLLILFFLYIFFGTLVGRIAYMLTVRFESPEGSATYPHDSRNDAVTFAVIAAIFWPAVLIAAFIVGLGALGVYTGSLVFKGIMKLVEKFKKDPRP